MKKVIWSGQGDSIHTRMRVKERNQNIADDFKGEDVQVITSFKKFVDSLGPGCIAIIPRHLARDYPDKVRKVAKKHPNVELKILVWELHYNDEEMSRNPILLEWKTTPPLRAS